MAETQIIRTSLFEGEEITVTTSSDNIFADTGLPNPDECLVQSRLAIYLFKEIKGLSAEQAAFLLDASRSHIRHIRGTGSSRMTIERLLRMVKRLGMNVTIACRPAEEEEGEITLIRPERDEEEQAYWECQDGPLFAEPAKLKYSRPLENWEIASYQEGRDMVKAALKRVAPALWGGFGLSGIVRFAQKIVQSKRKEEKHEYRREGLSCEL